MSILKTTDLLHNNSLYRTHVIYKELERVLKIEKYPLSIEKAAELTHNMYQMEIILPESLHTTKVLLKMDDNQRNLIKIINKFF